MLRHSAIALWFCASGITLAQEAPQHHLRVLAVGDQPPFIQEIRNGARYEVAPPAGSVPPRMVTIAAPPPKPGEGAGDKEEKLSMRLRLGQPSVTIDMPLPKDQRVDLLSEQGVPWLGVPLQSCGSSLALVWRAGPDWSKVGTIVLPDDSAARADGNTHFANLTVFPMAVAIGTEKVLLNPGKTLTRRVIPGPAIPLEISYVMPNGSMRLCHSASLQPGHNVFRRLVIYAADGKSPRSPVKVLQLEEPSVEQAPAISAR